MTRSRRQIWYSVAPWISAAIFTAFVTPLSSAANLTTLVSFNGVNGMQPYARLMADSAGNLFGTTQGGGLSAAGTVFRVEAGTNALTTLASFNGANGRWPKGGLVADAADKLYGTTSEGGASGAGTIFRVDAQTGGLVTLASFNSANGSHSHSDLIPDAAGNFYGTTERGGASDRGTIFRLEAGTNALTALISFDGANGILPSGGLVADGAGNLYGATRGGGANSRGTLFRFEPGTEALTTLASFNGANGATPNAGLVIDALGNIYGTTFNGGSSTMGTVFKIDAETNVLTSLASFSGANGTGPAAGLLIDAAGNLYGTTRLGGSVFRFEAATGVLTTLVSFNEVNGSLPLGSLVVDRIGNLYGTTERGGAADMGTVFKLSDTGFVLVPEPAAFVLCLGPCVISTRRPGRARCGIPTMAAKAGVSSQGVRFGS